MSTYSRTVLAATIVCASMVAVACGGGRQFTDSSQNTIDDRGYVYATFGAPDKVDMEPNPHPRPPEEGGDMGDGYPYERWHYDYIAGLGANIDLEFIDECMCSAYQLTRDIDTPVDEAPRIPE